MSGFVDLMEALPFGVVAIAILLVLACAGLIALAFCSIPPLDDDASRRIEEEYLAFRHPRVLTPERVARRKRAAHNIARHYHGGTE